MERISPQWRPIKSPNSVSEKDLPRKWQHALGRMRQLQNAKLKGMLSLDDRNPPSLKTIEFYSSKLRVFGGVCLANGVPIEFNMHTLQLWLEARQKAGNKNISIATGLAGFRCFSTWCDVDEDVIDRIATLQRCYARAGAKDQKRKDAWFHENDLSLALVWEKSEELLKMAEAAKPASLVRKRLTLDATCLALSVVCPLRVSDLHRIRIGEHIRKHVDYWSLSIETSKTGLQYDRPELWPELTPFLDTILLCSRPDPDVWKAYDEKVGTPLFSRDGINEVSAKWPSICWRRHFGIGTHIVRSLWHSMMFESEDDDQWIALALCGQEDSRTAQEYILTGAKIRASRRARSKLSAARKAALTE